MLYRHDQAEPFWGNKIWVAVRIAWIDSLIVADCLPGEDTSGTLGDPTNVLAGHREVRKSAGFSSCWSVNRFAIMIEMLSREEDATSASGRLPGSRLQLVYLRRNHQERWSGRNQQCKSSLLGQHSFSSTYKRKEIFSRSGSRIS